MNHLRTRTRRAEVVRGLGALAALVLLLAGIPAGLVVVGGSPVPHTVPAWDQITATLTQADTGNTLFLATIKVIGWIAWLLFTEVTVTEIAGYLNGRPARRQPGAIRPMQHLARDLVAMAALIVTATAPAAGSTTAPLAHPTVATGLPAAELAGAAPIPMASASQRPPRLAAAHHRSVDVMATHPWRTQIIKHGDTLWAIARTATGSGTKFPAIFNASEHLTQPHGLPPLTDPDRIFPGQHITIPNSDTKQPEPPRSPAPPHLRTTPAPQPGQHHLPHVPASSRPATTSPRTASPPTTPAPQAAPSSAPPRSPAPVTSRTSPHSDEVHRRTPNTVTLPTGAYVSLGLATAISVALAATRLHRRRRRSLSTEWPEATDTTPATPAPVAALRKAHLDTYTDQGNLPPSDIDLVAENSASPAPTHITGGTTRDGGELPVELAGLSLGVTGPGATAVVRALVIELLAKSSRYRVELVIPEPDANTLFAGSGLDSTELATAVSSLLVPRSLAAATIQLEAEFVHRARLMEATDQPDVSSLRINEPGEPLPAVVLIAAVPDSSDALRAILQLGRPYCIGGLLLGEWSDGTTVHVTADGTIDQAHGQDAAVWTGARLFHVTPTDASGMLQTIRTAHGAPDPEPASGTTASPSAPKANDSKPSPATAPTGAPASPAGTTMAPAPPRPPGESGEQDPRPVQLHLLGPIRIEVSGQPVTTGLRRITRELLTYLALHPAGITREQGIDALMPDRDLDAGTTMFHTAINNTRKVLRTLTGTREPMFVIHAEGRYRLDPTLIDADLWQLQSLLEHAQRTKTDTDRIETLARVPDLYTGEFAEDLTFEWAEAERERLRRNATDALAYLAHLTQNDHPEQALAALEQAIDHDPYAEPLYQAVMRTQARLGHTDAVRRSYQLLKNRLADLDTEPTEPTHRLLLDLLKTTPHAARREPFAARTSVKRPYSKDPSRSRHWQ